MNQLEGLNGQPQPEAPDLGKIIADLQSLIGQGPAVASKDLDAIMSGAPQKRVSLAQEFEKTRASRDALLQQRIATFQQIVEHNTRMSYLNSRQLIDEPGDEYTQTLEQLSLRSTLWKYEELHLQEFIESIAAYKRHLEQYVQDAESLRSHPKIARLELRLQVVSEQISEVVPVLKVLSQLRWAKELKASLDSGKVIPGVDPAQVTEVVTYLETQLTALQATLPEELQQIAGPEKTTTLKDVDTAAAELSGRLRAILQQTTKITVDKADQQIETPVPHALYVRTLAIHRDLLFQEIKNKKEPTLEEVQQFAAVQTALNDESIAYHTDTLRFQADAQMLLAFRERFGPEAMQELEANPEKAQQLKAFYEAFLLPEPLVKALKETELPHMQEGMTRYLELVAFDVTNTKNLLDQFEKVMMNLSHPTEKLIEFRKTAAGWPFAIPENTIGLLRPLGIDYAEWIGQRDELENIREVDALIDAEDQADEVDNIVEIYGRHKQALAGPRAALEVDMGVLRRLQQEHPPENYTTEHPEYREVKKKYVDVIRSMRKNHEEWKQKLEAFYTDLNSNMSYHINRMAQHRNVNFENSPSMLWGLGTTAAVLLAGSELGRSGGLRSIPRVGWWMRPLKKLPLYNYNYPLRLYHFAGRFVNAPTRLVTGAADTVSLLTRGRRIIPRAEAVRPTLFQRITRGPAAPYNPPSTPLWRRVVDRVFSPRAAVVSDEAAATVARQAATQGRTTGLDQASLSQQVGNDAFTRFLSNPRNAKLFLQLQDQQEIVEGLRTVLAERLTEDISELVVRDQLINAINYERKLRLRVASRLLGKRIWGFTKQGRAILAAHQAESLADTVRILQPAFSSTEDISKLCRAGVCGDGKVALNRLGLAGKMKMNAAAELLPEHLQVRAANGLRALTPEEAALVSRWWKSPVLKGMLAGAGLAMHGYILLSDVEQLRNVENMRKSMRLKMRKDLDALVARKIMQKDKQTDTYKFGDEFSVTFEDLDAGIATTAQNWRVGLDATSFAVFTGGILSRAAVGGAWALAILGVEITGRIAINEWERTRYLTYAREIPLWLMVRMQGTTGMMGVSELSLIRQSLTDVFRTKEPALQRKLLLTALTNVSPRILAYIAPGGTPEELDAFLESPDFDVFQTILLSELIVGVRNANIPLAGLQTDTPASRLELLHFLISSDPNDANLRSILRNTASALENHCIEQKFKGITRELASEFDFDARQKLITQQYELGQTSMYGSRLYIQRYALAGNGTKTRPLLIAERALVTISEHAGSGSWMDIIAAQKNSDNPQFTDTPSPTSEFITGTQYQPLQEFSYDRDFTFSVEGIAGLASKEELRFSDGMLRDIDYTAVPQVAEVGERIVIEAGDAAFPYILQQKQQLHYERRELTAAGADIQAVRTYIDNRTLLEGFTTQLQRVSAQLNAVQKEINEDYEAVAGNPVNPFRHWSLKDRLARSKILTAERRVLEESLDGAQKERRRIQGEIFFGRKELYADLESQSLAEITPDWSKDYQQYLDELQIYESAYEMLQAELARRKSITGTLAEADTDFHIEFAPELASELFPPAGQFSPEMSLVLSGFERDEFEELGPGDADTIAEFARLSREGKLTASLPDEVVATVIEKHVTESGGVEYTATYVLSSDPLNPSADESTFSYVQLGMQKYDQTSGFTEAGLFVARRNLDFLPKGKARQLVSTILEAREQTKKAASQDMIANMDSAERRYVPTLFEDVKVQVGWNEWGIRTKDNRLIYIKWNPVERRFYYKQIQAKDADKVDFAAMANMFAAQRQRGDDTPVRQLSIDEKVSARMLQAQMERMEWSSNIPDELIEEYELGVLHPSYFENVKNILTPQAAVQGELFDHVFENTLATNGSLAAALPEIRNRMEKTISEYIERNPGNGAHVGMLMSQLESRLQERVSPQTTPDQLFEYIGEIASDVDPQFRSALQGGFSGF